LSLRCSEVRHRHGREHECACSHHDGSSNGTHELLTPKIINY
jgi:hypothetical protein